MNNFCPFLEENVEVSSRIDQPTGGHRVCSFKERQDIIKERCTNHYQAVQDPKTTYVAIFFDLSNFCAKPLPALEIPLCWPVGTTLQARNKRGDSLCPPPKLDDLVLVLFQGRNKPLSFHKQISLHR